MRFKSGSQEKRFLQRGYLHILVHMYILTIYSGRRGKEKKEFSDSSHKGEHKSMWSGFYYFPNTIEKEDETNLKFQFLP